jgi:hypothetical protein
MKGGVKMTEASNEVELINLLDQDLDNYEEVTVETKDGLLYVFSRSSMVLPLPSSLDRRKIAEKAEITVRLSMCKRDRRFSFRLFSEGRPLLIKKPTSKVIFIKAKKK